MFSVRPVPDREGTSPAGDQQGLAYFRCHIHPDSLLPQNAPGTLFCLLPIYQETFSLFQTLREDHMQKVLTLTATCLLGILLCASAALADEVKTDHFTLNLPSGWTQPQPVQSAQGATMAILQNAAEQTVITVAVTPVPLSAKDLAIQTIANMKAAGFTTTEPVASGDSYVGEFSKEQVKGVSYFSANGKLGSVITIMGASLDAGKKMLKDNLKPADSKLFPTDF